MNRSPGVLGWRNVANRSDEREGLVCQISPASRQPIAQLVMTEYLWHNGHTSTNKGGLACVIRSPRSTLLHRRFLPLLRVADGALRVSNGSWILHDVGQSDHRSRWSDVMRVHAQTNEASMTQLRLHAHGDPMMPRYNARATTGTKRASP